MKKYASEGEDMYLNRDVITLAQAKERLSAVVPKKITQEKQVEETLGYTLAQDIIAPFPQPAFRRSGYDGYGILAEDDHDYPITLTLAAEVPAGSELKKKLQPKETIRIMTGAKVPDEVAKVIMLEKTHMLADGKVVIKAGSRNDNITPIGEEFEKGTVLLTKGTLINAGAISLMSAFGFATCLVYKRPKVAILATGTELLQQKDAPVAGKIYNSNGPLLEALVKENGGEVVYCGQIADDIKSLEEKLDDLAKKADLILTTGGVSVGDFDFLAVAAKESGQLLFNKLAMRPGSPTTAFVYEKTLVMALSGNPGACFTGFYLLFESLLQNMQGNSTEIKITKMKLAHDYQKPNSFDRYLRGTWEETATGKVVSLVGSDQSSALGNLHLTTCFFKIPHDTVVTAGTEVEVWCLPYK